MPIQQAFLKWHKIRRPNDFGYLTYSLSGEVYYVSPAGRKLPWRPMKDELLATDWEEAE